MLSEADKELMIEAFRCGGAGFSYDCDCGRTYVDNFNTSYDVTDEEVERLLAGPKTTAVRWAVQLINLEGKVYCQDCDCWHDRAELIVKWLRENQVFIGRFFKAEKKRLQLAVNAVPEISN